MFFGIQISDGPVYVNSSELTGMSTTNRLEVFEETSSEVPFGIPTVL